MNHKIVSEWHACTLKIDPACQTIYS